MTDWRSRLDHACLFGRDHIIDESRKGSIDGRRVQTKRVGGRNAAFALRSQAGFSQFVRSLRQVVDGAAFLGFSRMLKVEGEEARMTTANSKIQISREVGAVKLQLVEGMDHFGAAAGRLFFGGMLAAALEEGEAVGDLLARANEKLDGHGQRFGHQQAFHRQVDGQRRIGG